MGQSWSIFRTYFFFILHEIYEIYEISLEKCVVVIALVVVVVVVVKAAV